MSGVLPTIKCDACGHVGSTYRKIEYTDNRHFDVELREAHGGMVVESEVRSDNVYDDDVLEIEYRCSECDGDVTEEVNELLRCLINDQLAAMKKNVRR